MMWLAIGIVLGLGLAYLVSASRSGRVRVRWYQWLLGIAAVGLLLLAIQNYLALQDELEFKMAGFALMAFGVPGVISAVLAFFLPLVLGRKTAQPAGKVETA